MLYAITLTYSRPMTEIDAQLDAHRAWLVQHIKASQILVAGPLESGLGGMLLVQAADRDSIDALLAEDPYTIHDLVRWDVEAFTPAIRHHDLPENWAPNAKSV